MLRQSAKNSMINNEDRHTGVFSAEERAQIEIAKTVILEILKLLEEAKAIKEEILSKQQETDTLLKKLEDEATFHFFSSSPEKKD